MAQFLAFHTVRKKRDESEAGEGVLDALGAFLAEGDELNLRCHNEKELPPNDEADKWDDREAEFLRERLGESYIARFRSGAGLPMGLTSIASKDHRDLSSGIKVGTARLEQFIAELSAK